MNREALDAWFAEADDVLTDWNGGTDAMHARAADADADLPVADSYYAQRALGDFPPGSYGALMARLCEEASSNLAQLRAAMIVDQQRVLERVMRPRPTPSPAVVEYQIADTEWRPVGFATDIDFTPDPEDAEATVITMGEWSASMTFGRAPNAVSAGDLVEIRWPEPTDNPPLRTFVCNEPGCCR